MTCSRLLALAAALVLSAVPASAQLEVRPEAVGGSVTDATGGGFSLRATAGLPAVGVVTGGGFELCQGVIACAPAQGMITVAPTTLTVLEGGDDTFSVTLTRRPTADVTISVTSSDDGEASVSTSTLTFPAGTDDLSQTVTVTGVADGLDDGDQSVTVTLGVAESDDDGFDDVDPDDVPVTVQDADPTLVTLSASPLEVDENDVTRSTITATLTSAADGDVTVHLAFSGTATRGDDFTVPDAIVIPDGETSASVALEVAPDDDNDGPETVTVEVVEVDGNALEDGEQTVTIEIVGDALPEIAFEAVQTAVTEDAGSVTLWLVLEDVPDVPVEVTVALVSGDPDDLGGFTSETFTVGESGDATGFAVTVPITDDARPEDTESFVFALSVEDGDEPALLVGSPGRTAVVIVDDDGEAVTVTVPVAGPQFLALPIRGVTAAALAQAAGADSVFVFDPAAGVLVPALEGTVLDAGQPVLVDVEDGADLTLTGSRGDGNTTYSTGGAGGRVLVPVGNPTAAAVSLADLEVAGGTLADVLLVFDPVSGAFVPVSLAGLEAALDGLVLEAFGAVIVQVTPDGDPEDVAVSFASDLEAASGSAITNARFTPTDGETAVVLVLRPSLPDGAAGRPAESPGDTFALRLFLGDDGLDEWDGLEVVSPLGGTLATPGPAGSDALVAALSVGALEGQATVPLVVSVPAPGRYEIARRADLEVDGRPVEVEVFDGTAWTVVTAEAPFAFEATDADVTGGQITGRFAVRVSLGAAVSAEDAALMADAVTVYPNPTTGPATVEVAVPTAGALEVAVFDVLGREVARLWDGDAAAGVARFDLEIGALAPGSYVVRVVLEDAVTARRLTVTR